MLVTDALTPAEHKQSVKGLADAFNQHCLTLWGEKSNVTVWDAHNTPKTLLFSKPYVSL